MFEKPTKRILFIVQHRLDRSPGQRFRHEQYLPYLKANGFELSFSPLLSAADDRVMYKPGHILQKGIIFLKNVRRRFVDSLKAKRFDIIFIYREAFFTGTTWFEREMKASGAKFIFDFDDSIWLPSVSEGNRKLAFLKNPSKTSVIIAMSDLVFAGNQHLAEYAKRFNPRTVIVPTTVDTDEYDPARYPKHDNGDGTVTPVVIGWSGSPTTIPHFEQAIPALLQVKEKYGSRIEFRVMGDGNYRNEALGIQGVAWTREGEVPMLNTFDIGLMPLPDDEWSKGKCGLKGLVYMAMEVPALMSPVGVNVDIVQDGENGYLPRNTAQWVERISELVENPELRQRLGQAGRQTVVEKYSVRSLRLAYVNYYRKLAGLSPLEAIDELA
jgi:glycosyltransferase involved in cell wall biosynthesis